MLSSSEQAPALWDEHMYLWLFVFFPSYSLLPPAVQGLRQKSLVSPSLPSASLVGSGWASLRAIFCEGMEEAADYVYMSGQSQTEVLLPC